MGGGAPGSLSTLSGVIVPTCENMWGVLIFLRFFFVVGVVSIEILGTALIVRFAIMRPYCGLVDPG